MSNKTSDKNVVTEEDVIVLKNIEKLTRIEFKHFVTDRELEAIKNILAELEQKDKRIQELEEERDNWHGCFIAALESSIPKRVITDLIENETIDISGFECIAVEDLQELLGGERNESI